MSGRYRARRRCGTLAAALFLPLLLGACASVTRTLPDGNTVRLRGEAIREYASEVFRRHNAVSSTLLEALPYLEAQDPELADRLLSGEEAMNGACAPIDAVAIRYRDGASVDLGDKLAFAQALEACERETAALEATIATF